MQCIMMLLQHIGTMAGVHLPLQQVSNCLTFGAREGSAVVLPLTAFSLLLLDLLNGI